MARRRILVADVKEILVHWDGGGSISGVAHSLGYSRPTVRKYVQAAERVGLVRGSRPIDELGWERAARAAIADVGAVRRVGDATRAIAAFHEYLDQRVGSVRLSVLHQRLRDDDKLKVSWPTFYRYARQHWPDRLRPAPRITSAWTIHRLATKPRSTTSTSACGGIPRPSVGIASRRW